MRRGLLGIVVVGVLGLSLSGSAVATKIGPLGFSVGALKAPDADMNGDKVFDDLSAKLDTMNDDETLSVIVRMDGDLTHERADAVERSIGGFHLTHWLPIVDGIAATVTKSQVDALAGLDSVRQVELDGVVRAMNDSAQASFGVTRARADDPALDGNRDSSANYSKDDIVVAVIDTGIDPNHEQLDDGKVIGFANCLNQPDPASCSTPTAFDNNGHGTHVADTIAGDGEGHPQFKGVAPGAALVGVKVLGANGSGSSAGVTSGIQWTVDHKAQFGIEAINLSLGGGTCAAGDDAESDAVNAATAAGIAVFVAAGNDGPDRCTIGSPGAASTAITVGAMADMGVPLERDPGTGDFRAREPGFNLAFFSSRGPTSLGVVKPDVAAPGVHVTSAEAGTVDQYVTFQGTSMATPFVAGVAALMLDDDLTLTPAQIKTTLRDTAIDWGRGGEFHVPGSSGPDVDYGAGRLDAFAAIKTVDSSLGAPPAMPEHVVLSGSLPGPGTFQDFPIVVSSTAFPLAATLIMTGWVDPNNPDFDLRFFDPDGVEIGVPGLYFTRQEEMGALPVRMGTYRVRVESAAGSGDFILDVSGGAPPPPPPQPQPQPQPQPPPAPQPLPPPPPPAAPKPVKCKVPNVKGKTVGQARAALKARKCRLGAVKSAFNAKVKKGRVISQTRRPGRIVPRNTAVGVTTSKGARKKK